MYIDEHLLVLVGAIRDVECPRHDGIILSRMYVSVYVYRCSIIDYIYIYVCAVLHVVFPFVVTYIYIYISL
tara:strand:+ start:5188 stop:5400 length:213 start_codon:yes stop_codon:yes gene_type:complete